MRALIEVTMVAGRLISFTRLDLIITTFTSGGFTENHNRDGMCFMIDNNFVKVIIIKITVSNRTL